MTKNNQKKVVILRGINSNIIEEAILILRSEEYINMEDEKIKEKRNFILMNEANSIVENYEEEKNINKTEHKEKKQNIFQRIKIRLLSPLGIITLITIIYLICKTQN